MIVVFDMSGVFFNMGMGVAVKRISQKFNLAPEEVEAVLKGPFSKDYRSGLIDTEGFWKKAKERLGIEDIETVKDIFFSSYHPQQETVELVKKLKSRRIKVAFLSNSPEDRVRYLDKKYSFIDMFDFGMFSFEAKTWKPEPEMYQKFLDKFNLKAGDIIYTDDKESNLTPAKELGIKTILFKDVTQFENELNHLL